MPRQCASISKYWTELLKMVNPLHKVNSEMVPVSFSNQDGTLCLSMCWKYILKTFVFHLLYSRILNLMLLVLRALKLSLIKDTKQKNSTLIITFIKRNLVAGHSAPWSLLLYHSSSKLVKCLWAAPITRLLSSPTPKVLLIDNVYIETTAICKHFKQVKSKHQF